MGKQRRYKPRHHIKKQRHHFAKKGPYSQSYGFSSSHIQIWKLDHNNDWAVKNWCLQTVMLQKTLESPLDSKEIKPVHPKGNQPWIFFRRNDAEAEAPILWPPDGKSQLIGKDPDAGKDWGQEEKGMTEGEMVGWHYQLNGHEFAQTPGIGEGQESLACCSPWGQKESDMTEWMSSPWKCLISSPALFSTSGFLQSFFKILLKMLLLIPSSAIHIHKHIFSP